MNFRGEKKLATPITRMTADEVVMCAQMTAFRAVSHDDQIQLLKGGSIELLILRSVLTFDKDKQQFLDPLDPEETAAVKVTD